MTEHTTHSLSVAEWHRDAIGAPDPVSLDLETRTGDFRRYAATLHLLADAIAADAARHPATRNTTAMIARRVREAADDCAGVAATREAAA